MSQSRSDSLVRAMGGLMATAFVVLIAAHVAYAFKFHAQPVSGDPAAWGQFGDFIGGVANPVIGLLTLLAFTLTILLQSKQIDIAHAELAHARDELEKMLQAQAVSSRLGALAALFSEYSKLAEEKEAELVRVLVAQSARIGGQAFLESVKQERDAILNRKNHIFMELERVAGLDAAQQ